MNPQRVHSGNSRLSSLGSRLGLALLGISALAAPLGCGTAEDALPPVTVVSSGEPDDEPDPVDDPDERPINAPTPSDEILVEEEPPPFCGDGALNDDEQCDDANREAQDGCSANCLVVEQGFACPNPGSRCELAAICGDRLQLAGEQCDDGNLDGEDGCAANCQLERDFVCPNPGEPCVTSVVCGDGVISGDETCDDGDTAEGDGCGATCVLEAGWTCPIVNARCVAICGDGLLLGLEQCDDGDTTAGDGCSATCGNQDGFVCAVPGEDCVRAVCGNREPESNEGCDDANDVPFDGCFNCVREPTCIGGACGAVCGDGLRFDSEDCDDGNRIAGDGCSDECVEEPGFECIDQGGTGALGDSFVLPVIYRDFIGLDTSGDPGAAARATARTAAAMTIHPDFNGEAAQGSVVFQGDGVLGAVQNQLNAQRRPVFACLNPAAAPCLDSDGNRAFSTAARFNNEWYQDVPGVNVRVVDELELAAQGNGSFLFDSLTDSLNGQFDPLLGVGWHAPQVVGTRPAAVYESPEFCVGDQVPNPDLPTTAGATPRNMSFTTETRFVFEYAGGETFQFSGDDDVWVFVNNRRVIDLGGLHNTATGEFTLSAPPDLPGIALVDRQGPPSASLLDLAAPIEIDTQMDYEGVYEVVMFHAERHQCGSNFKLTLAGFDKPRSVCSERCGNGVATRSETCDQGELNGTGYGFCTTTCTPGPRCGDALVNGGGEVCDNGLNVDRYSTRPDACGPGCTQPSFCGDDVVDGAFGEACDDGVNNGDSYGGCNPTCQLGPRCGDREKNGPEECDDGNFINGDGCNLRCEIENDIVPS